MSLNLNITEYGVTQFNRALKDVIEDHFSYVRIKGEISEIRVATKGQYDITLKDKTSMLSAGVWEQKKRSLTFEPEIGMEVTLTGRVTTWSKFKTTYQIDVDKIEIAGEGALLKIIEERKNRLKNKGYFDDANKQKIPYLPSRIGVITSPTGSVIHDIINRISDRFKTPIDLWPVAVQGTEAAKNIIDAINGFNTIENNNKPDVIIIARGGGSTEDLMTFNDEQLAQVVSLSNIPIISAIGHETDTTIIDFVYAIILLYFKQYNDIPMSTTWVFVGLLCGRELAIATMNQDYKLRYVFPLIGKDFLQMIFGLSVSVGIVLSIHYILIPNGF